VPYKQSAAAGLALAVLAAAVLVSVFTRSPYLVLTNAADGSALLLHSIHDGEVFSVSYIHSVNISPVEEFYHIRQDGIVLVAIEFETFGAGMPGETPQGQSLIHLPEGGMRIEGYERPIGDLRYLVGYAANQTLNIGTQRIPLNDLASTGQSVRFALCRLNFWQKLYLTIFLPR